jgi:hypothetical protein
MVWTHLPSSIFLIAAPASRETSRGPSVPSFAGVVMQHVALAGPLVIGGVLKIGYDLLLYQAFRHVRPPEEEMVGGSREGVRLT